MDSEQAPVHGRDTRLCLGLAAVQRELVGPLRTIAAQNRGFDAPRG